MSAAAGEPASVVVPPPVAEVVARRGFGAYLAGRQDVAVRRTLGIGCGGAVVCLALLFGVAAGTSGVSPLSWTYSLVHAVAVGLFVAALSLGVFGLRALALGPRVNYLYEGGIVQRRRSGVSAIAWPDAVRMSPVYGKAQGHEGQVLAYRLDARDGTSITVAVVLSDNRDPFLDQVIEHVRRNGGVIQ